jgi:hypothetical protein
VASFGRMLGQLAARCCVRLADGSSASGGGGRAPVAWLWAGQWHEVAPHGKSFSWSLLVVKVGETSVRVSEGEGTGKVFIRNGAVRHVAWSQWRACMT